MDLALVRSSRRPDGIFSNLLTSDDHEVCMTLEHAYKRDAFGDWYPKIPDGEYECVRGAHRLHGMDHDFQTFEVVGVKGHSDLLFHWGNWNENSEGCILVGDAIAEGVHSGIHAEMITNSRVAFDRLMKLQSDVDRFRLRVY